MTDMATPGIAAPLLAMLAVSAALFAVARRIESRGLEGRAALLAYPFSLAVYFSSWTFFGGVGTAATEGWPYLAIYLGPAIVFLFLPRLLARLVRQTAQARASSVSEFLASCYDRDRGVAALVAGLALVASIPYIALQLKAISSSFGLIAGIAPSPLVATGVAALLAAFTISFGARRVEVAGRNPGVIGAIALESLVKLIAFVTLGLFALHLLGGAPPPVRDMGADALADRFAGSPDASFLVQTLLAGLAILLLPRQFLVTFVEAPTADATDRARWPFLLYLGLVSAMVIPLALAGLALLPAGAAPDLYVLELPLAEGRGTLALLAFTGGFLAATAMVIAEALALSTMAANDLVAPLALRRAGSGSQGDLGRSMRGVRRLIIIAILAAALAYALAAGNSLRLANFGLIAFAGVAQFAPALIAAIGFGLARPAAARAGLIAGGLAWGYTLFLPSIGGPELVDTLSRLTGGLLAPTALFGIRIGDALVHGTLWSLGLNLLALAAVASVAHLREDRPALKPGPLALVADARTLEALAARFVGEAEAASALRAASDPARAARIAERLIADVIGGPSARMIVTSALAGQSLDVADVVRLLDQSGQSVQFSRTLLAATLETLDSGVSVVDQNLRLVAWNRRYLEIFQYPPGLVAMGRPVADLIRHNALRGECGPGDVEAHVEKRLWHLKRGRPHSFERRRPEGRWIKTVGSPMPGGGYVMSFTDITAEKSREAELEARVRERTADLAEANRQLAEAKAAAEAATRDKTRFLAAASHDLQQPLQAARLFCEAIAADGSAQAQAMAAHVAQAIGSAETLLRTLLDVSRLDSGGIVPQVSRFVAQDLLAELAPGVGALAAEKGLRFRALAARDLRVETDRALLRSVLQNLLGNAVRYTRAGAILVTVRRRGERVVFAVADSGPGIDPADQARIFEEFQRLEATAGQPGAGLGLAIARRIARLIDARLELSSAPGRGSTFRVILAAAGSEGLHPLARAAE